MTKKEMLKHRASHDRDAVSRVLYALDHFAPVFVTPAEIVTITGLPFADVMKGIRHLLRRNPHIEADDSEVVQFKVRSKNLHIRKRQRKN
jgi:hypothetical protein